MVDDIGRIYTLGEAADHLRVSVRTLQRRISEAGLRLARPGRSVVLIDADMDALLAYLRARSALEIRPQPFERKPPRRRLAKAEIDARDATAATVLGISVRT